ncbi:MAG: hypothetical protein Q8K99_06480 [Actinomycetota bacterium]|nr:hypothetical protein [Actinomycetota bacterium]
MLRPSVRRRVLLAGLLAFAVLIGVPASSYAVKTLALSTASFKFEVAGGKTVGGVVKVANDGDEPIKVLVYAANQEVDEQGNVTYVAPNRADLSSMASPATWAKVTMPADSKSAGNIPYIEIEPGEEIPIKFSFTPPQGVAPGDHNAMLFFEMFDFPEGGDTSQSQVTGRLGARVRLRVAGDIVEQMEVRPFELPSFVVGDSIPYSFSLRNFGNVDQRMTADVLLLNRAGEEIGRQTAIASKLVFADESLAATGTISPPSPLGHFTAQVLAAAVDDDGVPIPGKQTLVKELSAWIVPLWLVAAAGVIAGLLVLGLIWWLAGRSAVRRSRKRDDTDADPGRRNSRSSKRQESDERRAAREARQRGSEGETPEPTGKDGESEYGD